MKTPKTNKRLYFFLSLLIFSALLLSGCLPETPESPQESVSALLPAGDGAAIHFIDVGQADCILIQADGEAMLIDSGNRGDGDHIIQYLTEHSVTALRYIIATHPHEDHIGSMAQIINYFPVEQIIMPPKEHTTKTFEAMLTAIEENDLAITLPIQGDTYALGSGQFTIISADKDYKNNLNDWSVSILYEYGDIRFISCGDLETSGEKDVLESGIDITADIYKVSHHGSSTSSADDFLTAISPAYGIIMCGTDNDYGHPHAEILERLSHHGVSIYRTDQQGTVVADTDGTAITFSFRPALINEKTTAAAPSETALDPSPAIPETSISEAAYILNLNTKKIHLTDCTHALSIKEENKQSIYGSYDEYLPDGFEPCKVCNP